MLREIQHSSLDGPRARGKNTWAAENPAVWKSETGLPWCLPSFSAELTSFLLIMPYKKIPIINRGCNAFRYGSPSVQKIANSIFISEGSFGGKTTMSFLCWFSFFAFILGNYFGSTGGVWGSVRVSLGTKALEWWGSGRAQEPGGLQLKVAEAVGRILLPQGFRDMFQILSPHKELQFSVTHWDKPFCPLCLAYPPPVLPSQNKEGEMPPTWATKSSLCAVTHQWPGCSFQPLTSCLVPFWRPTAVFSLTLQGVRPSSSGVDLQ